MKQIIDQSLHFSIGMVLVLLIGQLSGPYIAAAIVLSGAIGREIYQRVSKGNPWYACKSGCQLDIAFWSFGIAAGIFLNFILGAA